MYNAGCGLFPTREGQFQHIIYHFELFCTFSLPLPSSPHFSSLPSSLFLPPVNKSPSGELVIFDFDVQCWMWPISLVSRIGAIPTQFLSILSPQGSQGEGEKSLLLQSSTRATMVPSAEKYCPLHHPLCVSPNTAYKAQTGTALSIQGLMIRGPLTSGLGAFAARFYLHDELVPGLVAAFYRQP